MFLDNAVCMNYNVLRRIQRYKIVFPTRRILIDVVIILSETL